MKINTNSWHYKLWVKSYEDGNTWVPEHIDLCRYCHRVFWKMMSYVLGAALALGILGSIVYAIYCVAIHFLLVVELIGIILVVLVVLILPGFYIYWLNSRPNIYNPEPKTLVGKWLQARKQRVCPMVEFTSEE